MADDRMKNDNLDRNMGGASKQNQGGYGQGQNQGQQSPGRNKQDDDFETGQRGASQHQQGQQHNKDDYGTSEKSDEGQGGRNR